MKKKSLYIDLFSGCGGLSLGFYNSGFWEGAFAIEKDSMSFETLNANLISRGHYKRPEKLEVKNYDINEIIENRKDILLQYEGIRLITGGPPCQGFSLAGKRNPNDKRNTLVDSYLTVVGVVKPQMVLLENVSGFTSQKRGEQTYKEYVEEKIGAMGYDVASRIVDFSNFGVPQRRRRFILFATLKGKASQFFIDLESSRKEFLEKKKLNEFSTIFDAISDLHRSNGTYASKDTVGFLAGKYGKTISPYQKYLRDGGEKLPDSHRFAKHSGDIERRFAICIKNKLSAHEIKEKFQLKKNTTKLLEKDQPSPTLTTLPDDYIHYQEPRILTVREYARIQSFNDWYQFKGKYTTGGKMRVKETPRYTQIGNAIPPLFAECVANVLYNYDTNK